MRRASVLGLLLCLCASAVSLADTPPTGQKPPPSPEDVQKIMTATFGAMVPMMSAMTEGMIGAQLKMAAAPETADRIAAFKRNLFVALQKQGFTAEQALAIVVATAIPSASPGVK